MPKGHSEGIVLQVSPFREYDLRLDLLTEAKGRVPGFARNALKSKKRFGPLLVTGNILNLSYTEGSTTGAAAAGGPMIFLDEATLVRPLPQITRDLERVSGLFYLLDCIRTVVHEGQADLPLYHLLRDTLLALNEGTPCRRLIPYFQYQFLRLLGLAPQWGPCGRCGGEPQERCYFVYREGKTVCLGCLQTGESFAILSVEALRLLDQWSGHNLTEEEGGLNDLKAFLPHFMEYHLNRRLRSTLILSQVLR